MFIQVLCPIFNQFVFSCCSWAIGVLYIFWISILYQMQFVNIFSHSMDCFFSFFFNFLKKLKKFFKFLFIFYFFSVFQNSLLMPHGLLFHSVDSVFWCTLSYVGTPTYGICICIWYKIKVQFYFFAFGYPVFPVLLVKKTALSPL